MSVLLLFVDEDEFIGVVIAGVIGKLLIVREEFSSVLLLLEVVGLNRNMVCFRCWDVCFKVDVMYLMEDVWG
jgi:hypothetical protein